jgi:hypothetical protein
VHPCTRFRICMSEVRHCHSDKQFLMFPALKLVLLLLAVLGQITNPSLTVSISVSSSGLVASCCFPSGCRSGGQGCSFGSGLKNPRGCGYC